MRIVEIMSDFREIQSFLSNIRASPSAEDYNAPGYVVLRRCVAQAEALLAQPFSADTSPYGEDDEDRAQLQRCELFSVRVRSIY